MKKLKKMLITGIILFFMGSAFGVNAANAAEITVNEVRGNIGDSVVSSLSISQDTGFGAGKFIISFDPNKLEFIDYTLGSALKAHSSKGSGVIDVNENSAYEGKLTMVYISTTDVRESGDLINIKFNIKEQGNAAITVEVPEFVNNKGEAIGVSVNQISSENEGGLDNPAPIIPETKEENLAAPKNEIKKGETVSVLFQHYEDFHDFDLDQPIVWQTSDSSIAEIDNLGNIITKGEGTVTITATQGEKILTYEMNIKGEVDSNENKESTENLGNVEKEGGKQNTSIIFIVLGVLAVVGIGVLIAVENFRK